MEGAATRTDHDTSRDAVAEAEAIDRRFGVVELVVDEPDDAHPRCPVCGDPLDELALSLEAAGYGPAVCDRCGAVLAA